MLVDNSSPEAWSDHIAAATKQLDRNDFKRLWISGILRLPHRGRGGMLYYRLYYFDAFSGHIDHFREFEAEDDAAAVAVAEKWGNGAPMELWNRERRLKRWDQVPSLSD